jgi:putative phage-type endonuclease
MFPKALFGTKQPQETILDSKFPFKIIHLEQGTKEWLNWRNSGIGASDAPTIMNENRFKSREELLYEKQNKIFPQSNDKMKMGTMLEPEARSEYEKIKKIQVRPVCVQSVKYPWLIASLDGISYDYNCLVEIKCGESSYRKACSGIVPEYYYGQLQHELMITGLDELDYWCYAPDEEGMLIKVKRDSDYIDELFKQENRPFSFNYGNFCPRSDRPGHQLRT